MAKKIALDRLREISKHRPLRAAAIEETYAQREQREDPESIFNEGPTAGSFWI